MIKITNNKYFDMRTALLAGALLASLGPIPAAAGTADNTTPVDLSTAGLNTSAAPRHYDLTATVSASITASTDYANAKRMVEVDRMAADAAKSGERPHIAAAGSATRFDNQTTVALGKESFTVMGNASQTLSLDISDNIDIAGEIRAAASQAELQALADQLVAAQIKNARILLAKTTYYNLLRARHQVAVAQAALDTAQQQETTATTLNQQQVGQKIDVLRADTQVATAQQQLAQAQAGLGIAVENFDNVVGNPVDTPVTIDDVPGVTFGQSVSSTRSVGAPSPNITLFTPPTSDVQGISLSGSIDTAYGNRPEVLAAQVGVRVAQTGIKLARAGLQPMFGIDAMGDYFPTTSFEAPRQRTAAITATLTIPLYDGGATRDRVDQAKLDTENARATLDSRRSDVALSVGQAYLNLLTAASQISAANTALQQAIAARQLAQIRYEGQVALYLEVTDAQAALVQAENGQVNAVYDYFVARAQFENALGTPTE
ncbi:MAG: TolC family protein [Capsulimonadaceae bacterium]